MWAFSMTLQGLGKNEKEEWVFPELVQWPQQ